MYDLRRFFSAQHLLNRAALCGLCLVAFSLNVRADVAVDPAFDRFKAAITGNTVAVTFGSTGTPLAVAKSTAMGYVSTGLTPSSGELSRFAGYSTKYGEVAFKASQTITASRLAKGIGAVAGGPLGVGLLVLSFTADWLTDSGVSVDPLTGQPRIQDPSVCTSAPCNQYAYFQSYVQRTPWSGSVSSACAATLSFLNGDPSDPYTYQWSGSTSGATCTNIDSRPDGWSVGWASTGGAITLSSQTVSPSSPVYLPADALAIESALSSNPRTPSEIEKILSETIKYPEIQPDPADPVRIDPVTPGQPIKSPTKTDQKTTTNPDGSKIEETKSCWIKGTVQTGASMKLTEVCNTDTVTKSPSGTVTGTTTATTDSETSDATKPETDSDFCASLVGKLVCSDLDTPEAEPIDKTTKTLTYAPENHFGGGACPADQVMTTHNGQSLKVWDWATSCDKINQFFRPLFLTLCAFTALMILAPAVKEA